MNNMINLSIHRCTYWEEKLYCMAREFNLLFSIDIQDGTVNPIDAIPQEHILSNFICGHITIHNNKLIISPFKTKKIWIYDLLSKHWDSITIKERDNLYGLGGFFQTYIYNNSLFLIGCGYPAIICLDLENYSCYYIEEPYQDLLSRHPDIDFFYFRTQGVLLNNNLYLASCLDNYVLKFDFETKKYHWIKIGSDDYVYSEITWDGNNFWLSPRLNCDIVKWDGKDKIEILSMPPELKPSLNTYAWTACYDGNHVIFPCVSHPKSIIVDIQRNAFKIEERQYNLYTRLDNGMIISQTSNGELSIKSDDTIKKYHPSIDIEYLRQFYEKKNLSIFNGGTLYHETPASSLLSLENYLAFLKSVSQEKLETEGQVGKEIWEAIR